MLSLGSKQKQIRRKTIMKKATLILIVTLSSIMFAGVNVTWGNTYSDGTSGMDAAQTFGVWFDVNDATAIGWENGLKVSLSGSGALAASDLRLGYDGGTSLGVGWNAWEGGGEGWSTTLGTAIDFVLTTDGTAAAAYDAGDMSITLTLGFGF